MRSSQKYLDIHLAEQNKKHTFALANQQGAIAQLVEQRTENPCVPGSIPGGTTLSEAVERNLDCFFCRQIKGLRQQLGFHPAMTH